MILKCDLAQIMNAACCSLVPKLQKTMPLCVHPSCGFQQLFKQFDFFFFLQMQEKGCITDVQLKNPEQSRAGVAQLVELVGLSVLSFSPTFPVWSDLILSCHCKSRIELKQL